MYKNDQIQNLSCAQNSEDGCATVGGCDRVWAACRCGCRVFSALLVLLPVALSARIHGRIICSHASKTLHRAVRIVITALGLFVVVAFVVVVVTMLVLLTAELVVVVAVVCGG